MAERRSESREPSEPRGGHAAERLREFLRARAPASGEPPADADPASPEETDEIAEPAPDEGDRTAQHPRNDSLLAPPDTPDPTDTDAD